MSSSRKVYQSVHDCDTSIRGNNDNEAIEKLDTKQIIKNDTFFKSSSKNSLDIASEKETINMHIDRFLTTCESNEKNDKNNTENCLKRFEQEYNYLMKQKNEMKPTKCSIEKEVTETLLPNTKQIESINLNERSSVEEVERLNLTNINLNKIEELVEPDNNSLHGSNSNTSSKNCYNEDVLKKYHYDHNVDVYNNSSYKYEVKYSKEIDECFNDIKLQQQQVLSSNNKFRKILDGLNDEIAKIKELLTKNKETESLRYSDDFFYRSNEIIIDEDSIIQEVCKKDQQDTHSVQMLEKSSTNHEYSNQSKIRHYKH